MGINKVEETRNTRTFHLDETLGIKRPSWTVLSILSGMLDERDVEFGIDIDTFAFYNGRERSIGLSIRDTRKGFNGVKTRVVIFGECRNSDEIFVDTFELKTIDINPPVLKDFTEKDYKKRKYFHYNEMYKVADYIYETYLTKLLGD
jgi:hypothetical protein